MKNSIKLIVASIVVLSLQALSGAVAAEYIDTSGQPTVRGEFCRPMEKLADGRFMIYGTSVADAKLLRTRMVASGIKDEGTLAKWTAMAADNRDCTNRAGLNCSAGTCASGTCKEEKKGDYTGCACK